MRHATRVAAAMPTASVAVVMGAAILAHAGRVVAQSGIVLEPMLGARVAIVVGTVAVVMGAIAAIVVGAAAVVVAQVMLEADPGLVSMMMMGHDGHGQHQHADPE